MHHKGRRHGIVLFLRIECEISIVGLTSEAPFVKKNLDAELITTPSMITRKMSRGHYSKKRLNIYNAENNYLRTA